jgi:glycine/D-amino acid oxidase-like deaminating enzyme
LQDRGLRVTIYASELPPNTTSNVAGGQCSPFDVFDPGKENTTFMNQLLRATAFAYRRHQTLAAARYGIRWTRNYVLRHDEFDETDLDGMRSAFREFMPEMRQLTESEHPFSGYRYVRVYHTMLIERRPT